MKKTLMILVLGLCILLSGCSELDPNALVQQVETMAQQIDLGALVTSVVESIDWEELKNSAQKGYDALTEQYPALKQENISRFLKENGLKLMNDYLQSTDTAMQDNARKLGEIIKILSPELTDEVNAVLPE